MSTDPVPVVSAAEPLPVPQAAAPTCENCGVPLAGKFCAACGQRHEPHVHTLGHFASEAFETVTHADSRLWRTLGYLLVKPGFLTREFFNGKRARYLPPFRLYIVISLIFFLVAGLPEHVRVDGPPTAETVRGLNEAADNLEKQLGNNPGVAETARKLREQAAEEQRQIDGVNIDIGKSEARPAEVQVGFCDAFKEPKPDAGVAYQALLGFCKKVSHMSGEALLNAMVHNIPRAMFVFLPLLAGVMKLLYWRPKRFYVEHLLFLVHNHAFVFLAMIILVVLAAIPWIGGFMGFIGTAIWLYMFWYIFRAMRVYYEQSRLLTFGKYLFIGFSYIFAAALVLAGTALLSAIMLPD